MRMPWIVTLAVAWPLLVAGCGDEQEVLRREPPADAPEEAAGGLRLVIDNRTFPVDLTVSPAAEVTVINADTVPHTVTAAGAFDTDRIEAGGQATFPAPLEAGPYAFVCQIHSDMSATLLVK